MGVTAGWPQNYRGEMVWLPHLELNFSNMHEAQNLYWLHDFQDTSLNLAPFTSVPPKGKYKVFHEADHIIWHPFCQSYFPFSQGHLSLLAVLLLSTWLVLLSPQASSTVGTSSWEPSLIALDSLPVRAVTNMCSLLFRGPCSVTALTYMQSSVTLLPLPLKTGSVSTPV